MNILRINLIILLSAISICSYSQEEEEIKKIRFGIDFGIDFPNNKYADFLNGYHPHGVSRVLSNPLVNQQIENKLGYPILDWEFSDINGYNNSVFTAIYLGFDVSSNFSIIMKLDFSVVKFVTPLVIQLSNPQNFTGEYETALINAREQRFRYALGVEKKFKTETLFTPYVSLGASFNYIKLEKHELIISGTSYNIMRINNIQTLSVNKVDGFGYGTYLEGGALYLLNDKFSLGAGLILRLDKNEKYVENLTVNSAYNSLLVESAKGYLPSAGAYVRLIWN